jgi:hypothetical protein
MQGLDLRDGGPRAYNSLVFRLKRPAQAASAEGAIRKMGFNTFSAIDAMGGLHQVFAVVICFWERSEVWRWQSPRLVS